MNLTGSVDVNVGELHVDIVKFLGGEVPPREGLGADVCGVDKVVLLSGDDATAGRVGANLGDPVVPVVGVADPDLDLPSLVQVPVLKPLSQVDFLDVLERGRK